MGINETKAELSAILPQLPRLFSTGAARTLQELFRKYRRIAEGLPDNFSDVRYSVSLEFGNIESEIEWAVRGKPKNEAEARFSAAKEHMTDDINCILQAEAQDFEHSK